ncbi:glucose-6-phosphate isomerase [Halothermothrix orenii]|uniref:Glucose-6-phosphate isomerase n=1 Tax=Halothermothrix orenii (strain H 168 / OCM 544 / DSM 9562) TaxID=373903 RepID=B8CZD5_HALOH|nr:glucose-6-phosphate isomerase [Halothermothrix orenii]ACL70654.1 glucose-6-phosphate isomerase [Halothermothrix orenii H 168]
MSKRFQDKNWCQRMRIRLDVNNMFSEMVGEEHGLLRKEVDDLKEEIKKAHENIHRAKNEGKMGFMELPFTQKEVVEEIRSLANELKGKFDNFVVLGIGGSALGNIALQTALNDPYYNYKSEARDNRPRLFVPDNVDPARFKSLLETLDLKRTIFNVISKSGSTAETMSQFLIARKAVAEEVGEENVSRHFIATTSQDSGYLIKIAKREGFKTFYIPENVGGRFSVLTPVGLVSAAFCGIDIEELLAGAAYMDEICRTENVWENPAYLNGVLQYLAYKKGKPLSVMMPYVHALKDVADWYRQLWAESLGKKVDREGNVVNVGPTPIKALGATDQHSQVQLYMEGPYDKVITFLEVKDYGAEVEIPGSYKDIEGVSYLGGHTLNELIQTEKRATELALTKNGRLNCTITLPEVNEFTMGQLLYMFELQTALVGELLNINAFNQPGVELGKHYTYGVLGRNGYEDKKEEYFNRPEKNDNLII